MVASQLPRHSLETEVRPELETGRGLRVIFVLKTSPNGFLPVSFVRHLNVTIPLTIAAVARYLKGHGFAYVPLCVSRFNEDSMLMSRVKSAHGI